MELKLCRNGVWAFRFVSRFEIGFERLLNTKSFISSNSLAMDGLVRLVRFTISISLARLKLQTTLQRVINVCEGVSRAD